MKKGLVISGGGSKGAFAGGIVEYLMNVKKFDWDVYVGTSTGNLLCPLISLHKIEELKCKYTTISDDDIYSVNPFKKNGNISIWNAVKRLISKKSSLGEGQKLRNLISTFLTENDYRLLLNSNKDVFSCVTNYTTSCSEYKSIKEESWEDFCDWMFASASVPIAFNITTKNNNEYFDGGMMNSVPIQKAINEGCSEIDVIVLKPEKEDLWYSKNANSPMFGIITKTLNILLREISMNDIQIGTLESINGKNNILLNIYYAPIQNNNIIHFDKTQMLKWWTEGYIFAENYKTKSILMQKKGNKYTELED